MAWIIQLPAIVSAIIQLTKLLLELSKSKENDQVKACAVAIKEARMSGDIAKLNAIIEKMAKGHKCE